jgi:putative transposase
VTRHEWVAARKAEGFPITKACDVAGVSRQAFHDWKLRCTKPPTPRETADQVVVDEMQRIVTDFDGTYGEPRMSVELRNRGHVVNHKRVARLMRCHGIVGVHKTPKIRTTIPVEDAPVVPDLIGRRFTPGAPDVAWAGDITYVRTGRGWLYVASVLDLGSRRLLGYAMANHMRTDLIADALTMAVAARGGATTGIVFHSDRGSQYLSDQYRTLLDELGMVQSVGRTGICWDNSVAEAFWSSLKRELVDRYRFNDHATARRAIFAWINRYNHRRLHSSLRYQTPEKWEEQYRQHGANPAAA